MGKRTLRQLTAVLDRSLYFLIACALVVASMFTLERGLPPALLSSLASLSQAAGLRQTQRGTWTTYTVENTSQRVSQVATVTKDTPGGWDSVLVDFASKEEADTALASGYVMFGDDPTVYRYRWYNPDTGSISIEPPLKQDITAGTPLYTAEVGLACNRISAIATDEEDNRWFGTDEGVSEFDGATWTSYTFENTSQRGDQVTTVTRDTPAGRYSVLVDFASTEEADAALASGYVMFGHDLTIYRYWWYDPYLGSIYIRPSLRQSVSAGTPVYAVEVGLVSNGISAIAMDQEGNKWFGTWDGVSKFDGTAWTTYNTSNSGLADNSVTAIDKEGNKWFGTWRGVSKFDGTTWTTYNTSNSGLASNSVSSIAIDDSGDVWIGTFDNYGTFGGVSKFDGVAWTAYNTSNSGLASNYVQSIVVDSPGVKWFGGCKLGYEWSPGSFDCDAAVVSRFDGTNWTSYIAGETGLVGKEVKAIAIDREGKKWFGTDAGVSVFDGTNWTTYNTANSDLVSDCIKALAADDAGDVWIGTDAGVSVYSSNFAVSSAANDQRYPAVAYNQTEEKYLVVWQDYHHGNWDVYGQRISGCISLGDAFPIVTDPGGQVFASVAYNSTRNEYLVIWQDSRHDRGDIYGQRLSSQGGLLGDALPISTAASEQSFPELAYDPGDDRYLVVWADARNEGVADPLLHDVYRQLVSGSGELMGSNLPVALAADDQNYPQVVYNSINGDYLVVWEDHRNLAITGTDLYGQRISSAGALLGNSILISKASSNQGAPALAYNAHSNEYLVVWQDDRNAMTTGTDIYRQRVKGDGQLVGNDFPISTGPDAQYAPVVAYSEQDNNYLVVWHDLRRQEATERDIYGRQVSSAGKLQGREFVLSTAVGNQRFAAIAYDSARNDYLIVWEDYRNSAITGADIYAQQYQPPAPRLEIYLPLILKGF